MRLRRLLFVVAVSALAATGGAETIVLEGGHILEADQAWYEGTFLRYRKDGRLYDIPREAISRVESSMPGGALLDPDVLDSRQQLAAGDTQGALLHARLALFRDPTSLEGLDALAAAQLALGQADRARASASDALLLAPEHGPSLELLGDSLLALGDVDAARERYRLAYDLSRDGRLWRKIEDLEPPSSRLSSARFTIRYDGAPDQPLGLEVMSILDRTWEEYEGWLGFSPDLPVNVVLLTTSRLDDATLAPGWAVAWNDGVIRVPVRGIDEPTAELIGVLRHELTHSFLVARIGGPRPTWLQEGLAQWLEGGDPARGDAALAPAARSGRLWPLRELEGSFADLSEAQATSAYVQSLSAVAHLLRLKGPTGVQALVDALASGRSTDEALTEAFGLGYDGLQTSWEVHLKNADGTTSRTAAR